MIAFILAALLASPDLSKPGHIPLRRSKGEPRLVVGHGFMVWEHPDGSCEMFDPRTVYSGVFIAGPRRNWWPDRAKKGQRK
jgi:hypothetical protein